MARNTLFSAVGEGSNLLLFLLGFLMARFMGDSAFGAFAEASAFVGLFRILPDFGMSYASTLEIARDRSRAGALVGNLLGFQVALSALTVALCVGLGSLLYDRQQLLIVALLCADLLLKAVKSTLRWLLKGFERFGGEALSLLLERLALVAAVLLAIRSGGGLLGVALAFALVRLVDTLGLAGYVHAAVLPLSPRRDTATWRELLGRGLPFAYAGAMVTLFFQVDQVMIGQMRGARESGWYRAPVLVLEGLTLVPRILGYAFIPAMAAWHRSAPASVTALYRRGVKYLLLVGLPVAAFGPLAARPFVSFLFGAGYEPSAPAAAILIPVCVFMFLSNFSETTLACIDRWRAIVLASTAALLLNVALNLAWIPRYGYLGAAWATLLTEGTYFLLSAWALGRAGHRVPWAGLTWKPALCAAAFALALQASLPLGLLPAAGLASLTWIAAVLALRVIEADEWQALRGLARPAPPAPPA